MHGILKTKTRIEVINVEELKQWLIDKGFRIYDEIIPDQYNIVKWYACKRTKSKRECGCNKKPVQIVVSPYKCTMNHGIHESITVDITAEYKGLWYKFQVYSLSTDEFKKKLNIIEKRLVNAWEAL